MQLNLYRYAAIGVGFGTCFASININVMGRPISLGLIFSFFYLLLMLLKVNQIGRIFEIYGFVPLLPFLFIFTLAISDTLNAPYAGVFFPTTLLANWFLMIFILNHSLDDSSGPIFILYGCSLGTSVLTILFLFGVGIEYNVTRDGVRVLMFGCNPNLMSIIISVGAVILLNKVIIQNILKIGIFRLIAIFLLILHYSTVFILASRTGAIILIGVSFASVVLYNDKKTIGKHLLVLLLCIGMCCCLFYFLQSDSIIANRLGKTIADGETSGRTDIWLAYLNFVFEQPVLGFGNTGLLDVSLRAGLGSIEINGQTTAFSPHNVLLEILLISGGVGFVIMTLFFVNVFLCGIRAFFKQKDSTPILLSIPLIVTMLSGQLLSQKIAWIVYAYMISTCFVPEKLKNN